MTLKLLILLLLLTLAGIGLYHTQKPLPPGISYRGTAVPLEEPVLLTDVTRHYQEGREERDHEIFDEVFRLIGQANEFILIDMFLFNSTGLEDVAHRPLAQQLTEALLARKAEKPELAITVISDPLNTMYGGTISPWFEALRNGGIPVVETALRPLRDSNPTWSSIWRLCCQWFGNNPDGGWLDNALGTKPVTLRSYLALLNFKANHRKLVIADEAGSLRAIVTSANPHDGSSRHSNLGLSFKGPAVIDLLKSERAVLAMSGADTDLVDEQISQVSEGTAKTDIPEMPRVAVLTESAILDQALAMIHESSAGDQLDLAIFYLSHRDIVKALLDAAERGVALRVLLDANNEAFGHQKSGIPNRQVAMELVRAGVPVRWCNTLGEQCHTKLLMLAKETGATELLLGSANFTRRNLDDLNLETDVWVSVVEQSQVASGARRFFDEQWQKGPGDDPVMSLPYERWADESRLRYWRYRIMEATGLSTF
ncbi:Phosphatidylserine/phosphatidylglycerophosphate/cardiolipin synthase [Marinobacter sp. es.048]|uniref:phospholipase D family protein n=1 Tax=Marinobacter sp. es.048 TaxID=1761795 RepID=UPI000B588E80|nr:phospholipase D family protein [Marinobacter sp. es.048]SNC75920.1 Phosphatidylserine/phosphatidylglycerophosphate/cardiolipin synthase [Marinobacter sp. es.048]